MAQRMPSTWNMLAEQQNPLMDYEQNGVVTPVQTTPRAQVGRPKGQKITTTKPVNRSPDELLSMAETIRSLPEMQAQQRGIADLENQLAMTRNQKPDEAGWLRPLLAFSDSETGSKLLSGHTPGMTEKDKNEQILKYMNDISQRKSDLSKSVLSGLGAMKNGSQTIQIGGGSAASDNAFDRSAEKLSDKLAPLAAINSSIEEVEAEIQNTIPNFKLDSYNGAAVDLPGVSVPGFGTVSSFLGKNARLLDSAMSRVFNIELKTRSGSAVTNPELRNLQREFASGAYNTEEEKLLALKRYKRLAGEAIKHAESGFRPEVRDVVSERGGFTSKELSEQGSSGGSQSDEVTVSKGSETYTIPRADLESAKAEGFREL